MGRCLESKFYFNNAYETAKGLKTGPTSFLPIFKLGLGAVSFLQGRHKEAL